MGTCSSDDNQVTKNDMELPPNAHILPAERLSKSMTIHLIRHGEAKHNVYGKVPGNYLRPSLSDAALTETGITQCKLLNEQLKLLHKVENSTSIFISPMERTLNTAMIGLAHVINKSVNICAIEFLREETGLFPCDRRSSVSCYKLKYPLVDFSKLTEEDPLFYKYTFREPKNDVQLRCDQVLKQIRELEDNEIIIVSHSSFLTQLLMKLLEHGNFVGDSNNSLTFRNAECKSIKVTF